MRWKNEDLPDVITFAYERETLLEVVEPSLNAAEQAAEYARSLADHYPHGADGDPRPAALSAQLEAGVSGAERHAEMAEAAFENMRRAESGHLVRAWMTAVNTHTFNASLHLAAVLWVLNHPGPGALEEDTSTAPGA